MPTALLVWFGSYVAISLKKLGITDSLSDTWYKWIEKHGKEWPFTLFCGGLGLGLIGIIHQHQLENVAGLMFALAAASAWFVAVAANFRYGQKERKDGKRMTRVDLIHYAASGMLIGCCLIALWIQLSFWYAVVFAVGTVAILLLKAANRKIPAIYLIECWAFAVIDSGLYQL